MNDTQDFLEKTNTTLEIEYSYTGKYFPDDEQTRNVYDCTLENEHGFYKFTFGDSIVNTYESDDIPSEYDILSSLEKYDPESFEDFCGNCGYDEDSRKAYKIFEACEDQYQELEILFTQDQLEELREIQ